MATRRSGAKPVRQAAEADPVKKSLVLITDVFSQLEFEVDRRGYSTLRLVSLDGKTEVMIHDSSNPNAFEVTFNSNFRAIFNRKVYSKLDLNHALREEFGWGIEIGRLCTGSDDEESRIRWNRMCVYVCLQRLPAGDVWLRLLPDGPDFTHGSPRIYIFGGRTGGKARLVKRADMHRVTLADLVQPVRSTRNMQWADHWRVRIETVGFWRTLWEWLRQ